MSNYQVGVNLVEGKALNPIDGISTAVTGIIGNFERGPMNKATLVTNMTQFERTFGTKPLSGTTSWYSVKAFFAKAGKGTLYVVRVAGTSKAKATVTLVDRESSPANALQVDAASEGTWGNGLAVVIADSPILSTTYASDITSGDTSAVLTSIEGLEVGSDISITDGANTEYVRITAIETASNTVHWSGGLTNGYLATDEDNAVVSMEFGISVYVNNILTETWTGLSLNADVSFYVEKKVTSTLIACTDVLASKTDSYEDLPAVASATDLTGGHDGMTDVVGSDYSGSQAAKSGVYAFDAVDNLFRFACPNPKLTDVDAEAALEGVIQACLDYTNARVTCQYYADVPYGKSVANAKAFAAQFTGRRLVFAWPWLVVRENATNVYLPPSTFVLGAAVEKDYRRGVHKNIGNETLPYAIDLEYKVSRAEGEELNNYGVNTVREFVPGGIKIYGGRTMSTLTSFRFVHYSELWNFIGRSLEVATQDVPFEPNDETLWKGVVRRIEAFLSNQQAKRALFDASNPGGRAFVVKMDSENNPVDQVALGIAMCEVEYVPTGTAEKFVVKLTSSPMGLTLTTSA